MGFIRHPKDFWAGVMFIAFGLAAIGLGASYPMGSGARMGPGYFPRGLGVLLILLGGILALRGMRSQGAKIAFPTFQPLLIVLGAVVLFGLALNKAGLVLATILLIVVSSTASHEFRWKEAVIASAVLATFVVAAFRYGLNLQIPIWPTFLAGG